MDHEGWINVKAKGFNAMFNTWNKKWVRIANTGGPPTVTLSDNQDEPGMDIVLDAASTLIYLEAGGPKGNNWTFAMEGGGRTLQFQLANEGERMVWAISLQQGILAAARFKRSEAGEKLYGAVYRLEAAAVALRAIMAVSENQKKSEKEAAQTPPRRGSDKSTGKSPADKAAAAAAASAEKKLQKELDAAQEHMAKLVQSLSEVEQKFKDAGSHWEAILAPFQNLVPRAGMAISGLHLQSTVNEKLSMYKKAYNTTTGLLRCGKLRKAHSKWGQAQAIAHSLLTDPKFRVQSKSTPSKNKSFFTGKPGTALSPAAGVPYGARREPDRELLPALQEFEAEYKQHIRAIKKQFTSGKDIEHWWYWHTLANRVTSGFDCLAFKTALLVVDYSPPFADPPALTNQVVEEAKEVLENVRKELDLLIRTIHGFPGGRAIKTGSRWVPDDFANEATTKWKHYKDNVTEMERVQKEHHRNHLYYLKLHAVLNHLQQGQIEAAEVAWKAAKELAKGPDVDKSKETSIQQRARTAYETYVDARHNHVQACMDEASRQHKEVQVRELELDGEDKAPSQGHESGKDKDKALDDDPLSPEKCVERALWWIQKSLSSLGTAYFYPYKPAHTSYGVTQEDAVFATLCHNSLRRQLDELMEIYSGVDEMEEFFAEGNQTLSVHQQSVQWLSTRASIQTKTRLFYSHCQALSYICKESPWLKEAQKEKWLRSSAQWVEAQDIAQHLMFLMASAKGGVLPMAAAKGGGSSAGNKAVLSDLLMFGRLFQTFEKELLLSVKGGLPSLETPGTPLTTDSETSVGGHDEHDSDKSDDEALAEAVGAEKAAVARAEQQARAKAARLIAPKADSKSSPGGTSDPSPKRSSRQPDSISRGSASSDPFADEPETRRKGSGSRSPFE